MCEDNITIYGDYLCELSVDEKRKAVAYIIKDLTANTSNTLCQIFREFYHSLKYAGKNRRYSEINLRLYYFSTAKLFPELNDVFIKHFRNGNIDIDEDNKSLAKYDKKPDTVNLIHSYWGINKRNRILINIIEELDNMKL